MTFTLGVFLEDLLRNAFTVDVEEHFHVAALKQVFNPQDWSSQESRVEGNTLRILEILAKHEVRATFFVLGWVAERHPSLVRAIAAAGHEVACHGQSHQLIYDQEPSVFRAETLQAKKSLEDITGLPIAGYRAASYSITNRSAWALKAIAEAGFQYDSSVIPARHDLYGMPGAPPFPHRIRFETGAELIEFPPSTLKIMAYSLPIGGGGYFRIFPYWFSRWGMKSLNRRHGRACSFYVHPWEIDTDQPRVRTNWKSRFRHYVNLHKCEARLNRLLKDFEFSTMNRVLKTIDLPIVDFREYGDRF